MGTTVIISIFAIAIASLNMRATQFPPLLKNSRKKGRLSTYRSKPIMQSPYCWQCNLAQKMFLPRRTTRLIPPPVSREQDSNDCH